METKDKEFLNDLITTIRSFSNEELNKNYLWNLIEVMQTEANDHGDRAILKVESLYRRLAEL